MSFEVNTNIYAPAAIEYCISQLKDFADFSTKKNKISWEIEAKNIQSPWDKSFEKHFKNLLLEVHMNMKAL